MDGARRVSLEVRDGRPDDHMQMLGHDHVGQQPEVPLGSRCADGGYRLIAEDLIGEHRQAPECAEGHKADSTVVFVVAEARHDPLEWSMPT